MTNFSQRVNAAADSIRAQTDIQIDTTIILGSGLSDIDVDGFSQSSVIPYSDIKGLPLSTAPSHKGELRILSNGTKAVAVCAGRHHLYEGYSAAEVSMLTYVIAKLGAQTFIVTNASGALNPSYQPGDIMIIDDHINLTGTNPLIGQDEELGPRFPDMSEAYSRDLVSRASKLADTHGLKHHQGIYAGVTGPSLETSAERRMFRQLGADAVGMSTVTEVIAANHAGMNVLGLAAITNLATGDENQQPDTIEEVLAYAEIAGQGIKKIVEGLLSQSSVS